MRLSFRLNGKQVETDVRPDMLLLIWYVIWAVNSVKKRL